MNELTRLLDVITPEIYLAYTNNFTKERSAIIQSGVAVANSNVSANINSGGLMVHMPFWEDLDSSETEEILGDGDKALGTGKIVSAQDMAAVMYRGRGWAVNELAAVISGDNPMEALLSKIALWWMRREQRLLIDGVLDGLFGTKEIEDPEDENETIELVGPLAETHMNDQSAKVISNDIILDSKQLLGDASDQLSLLLMHSKIYTSLQKLGLIEFLPDIKGHPTLPTYLGYRVVVDDGCPVDVTDPAKPVFTTFLFRAGSIGRNLGHPQLLTLWETARDAKRGNDEVYTRKAFTMHPLGIKFLNLYRADNTDITPANADLANPGNWKKVYEDKQIGIIAIKSLAL